MTAAAKPTLDDLAAENTALKQALRLQALTPKVCLLCHSHRITLDALARLDRAIDIPEPS